MDQKPNPGESDTESTKRIQAFKGKWEKDYGGALNHAVTILHREAERKSKILFIQGIVIIVATGVAGGTLFVIADTWWYATVVVLVGTLISIVRIGHGNAKVAHELKNRVDMFKERSIDRKFCERIHEVLK